MIRVLVADDQVLVRQGFALILGTDAGIDVVGEAGNGVQLLARARQTRPDVVLMDIAGASGFLLKDTAADLIPAVRTVAAGDALLAPAVTRGLIEKYVLRPGARPQHSAPGPALPALTERETGHPRRRRPRTFQRRDRRRVARQLLDREDSREPSADQARRPESGPARGDRLPSRSGHLTSGPAQQIPLQLLRSRSSDWPAREAQHQAVASGRQPAACHRAFML